MDKFKGLAALFGADGMNGNWSLSLEAYGISTMLNDWVRDLDQIYQKNEKELFMKPTRERWLEQVHGRYGRPDEKDR